MNLQNTTEYICELFNFSLSVKKEINNFCIIMNNTAINQYIWNKTTTSRPVFKWSKNEHDYVVNNKFGIMIIKV